MPWDLTNDMSTLVQVMAWCCQATSHYQSQCWPSSPGHTELKSPLFHCWKVLVVWFDLLKYLPMPSCFLAKSKWTLLSKTWLVPTLQWYVFLVQCNWQHEYHLMPYTAHMFSLQMTNHLQFNWLPGSSTGLVSQLTRYVDSDEIGMNEHCRRCFNYIFILALIPGFNGLGKGNCKTRGGSFKFWELVWLILETLHKVTQNFSFVMYFAVSYCFPTGC